MDQLFETGPRDRGDQRPLEVDANAPLAARMRPRDLDEYVGQHEVVGPGSSLRKLLERDRLTSLLLWGPPGSGKTSLAAVIAGSTDAAWAQLSAVTAGVKDVRAVIEEARQRLRASERRTVLFIDEIHRFNKAQQDALLPAVENGWVVLVGATTENPFFELNAPLISRCRLVRLEPLDAEAVRTIVERALSDPERGYGGAVEATEDAIEHLVVTADGDARTALAALEVAVQAAGGAADPTADTAATGPAGAAAGTDTPITVDVDDVQAALASKRLRYDKAGDQHYDQISAFIKSMRGSDPDAAVYWLTRMLDEGEDPRFLARRMVIFASEDVGLADRTALPTAVAAFEALDRVGLPEARHNLTHAVIALATAPKSNAVTRAMAAADRAVASAGNAAVPVHLRDAHYRGADRLGHGSGYRYPHDYADGHVAQQYLPDELTGTVLYEPTDHGDEAEVRRRVRTWRDTSDASNASDASDTSNATGATNATDATDSTDTDVATDSTDTDDTQDEDKGEA